MLFILYVFGYLCCHIWLLSLLSILSYDIDLLQIFRDRIKGFAADRWLRKILIVFKYACISFIMILKSSSWFSVNVSIYQKGDAAKSLLPNKTLIQQKGF